MEGKTQIRPLVWIDTETSGLDPAKHEIIQLAAIVTDERYKELDTFNLRLQFSMERADEKALAMNHYDPEVWAEEAVPPSEACERFAQFIEPWRWITKKSKGKGALYNVARLAGHNVRFDTQFLLPLFQSYGRFLAADAYQPLDTLQLALWTNELCMLAPPFNYRLTTLCKLYGVPFDEEEAHDALTDVRLCIGLTRALRQHLEDIMPNVFKAHGEV